MLSEKELKIYRVIGKLQKTISTSKTFNEAVENGLKEILDSGIADYAVIWYQPKSDVDSLSAYYWICPYDFSVAEKNTNSEIVGETFKAKKTVFAEKVDQNSEIKKLVPEATSVVCVPFLESDKFYFACVEFIKVDGTFTEEQKDICEIVTSLAQMIFNEEAPSDDVEENKEILISVKDVKKTFTNGEVQTQVLKGINFNVFKGEFLCLLGESGCGKSTVLNIIAGLLEADSGSVLFEGKELIGLGRDELTKYRRENIGFIFQQYNLMNNLNAYDNVKLIAELVKDPMDSMEALKLVKLENKAHNYPSQLSGGQQQRISIARALVKKPKLIFADEPTAALDFETSIEVLEVLSEVLKTGTTLVMVTHNEEIARMANRVIRFKSGRVFETVVNRHPVSYKDLEW